MCKKKTSESQYNHSFWLLKYNLLPNWPITIISFLLFIISYLFHSTLRSYRYFNNSYIRLDEITIDFSLLSTLELWNSSIFFYLWFFIVQVFFFNLYLLDPKGRERQTSRWHSAPASHVVLSYGPTRERLCGVTTWLWPSTRDTHNSVSTWESK